MPLQSVPAKPFRPAQCWARALHNLAELDRQSWSSLPALVDELAGRFGGRPALISLDETMTYSELADNKNKCARWAAHNSIGLADTVCLLMANCPSYFAIWLGILQAGACAALLNTNVRGAGLVHAISSVRASTIIVGRSLLPLLIDVRAQLPPDLRVWVHGEVPQGTVGARLLDYAAFSGECAAVTAVPAADMDRTALLIFTSGTTGLPKAARLSHYRLLEWSLWFAGMMGTSESDRLFNCLPMYHSTGGVAAIGGVLLNGGAVVIRERFSARRFWADVVENGCTIFLYIGELCRYLLNAPEDANDRRHSLRLCVGNGLRADVWQAFQNRFRIQSILEFYASTEGNVSLYNCEGRPGAIGRIPAFLAHRFPVALIQCHVETGEPLRDADNRCILCEPGCVGEAIGQISTQGGRGTARFEGYTDAAATERKIIRDVFAEGDAWFRTGDLMRRDAAGFFYFVDRMGDTFRWKGENVSTTEVGEVLARYPGVAEAIVYGVPVEAEEGRACMAALSTTADFDLQGLPDFLAQCLPPYARPIFLRLCSSIEATGTFKPIKTRLMHEAFDPSRSEDPLFQFCRDRGMFVEMVRDRLEVLV